MGDMENISLNWVCPACGAHVGQAHGLGCCVALRRSPQFWHGPCRDDEVRPPQEHGGRPMTLGEIVAA